MPETRTRKKHKTLEFARHNSLELARHKNLAMVKQHNLEKLYNQHGTTAGKIS
jgi:hypothetical protein